MLFAEAGAVGRYGDRGQAIRLPQFAGSLPSGAGHARELPETAEKPLKTQASNRLRGIRNGQPLLGFHRLVHPFTPAALRHGAAGKFVDNDHLAAVYDILLVAVEE